MHHRKNNFDFIRMAAALCVLISHQFALSGLQEPSILGAHSLGGLGVLIFFSISGFLVTKSWDHDPSILRFAMRRLLRIWPAFAVAIFLAAAVMGPLVSTMSLRSYYAHPLFDDYFKNLGFCLRDALPLQFLGNALPNAVNGSLWTIPLELKCYVALGILGICGLVRPKWLLPALTIAAALIVFFYIDPQFAKISERFNLRIEVRFLVQFGMFFFAGAALYRLDIISSNRKATYTLILGCLAAVISYTLGKPILALWLCVPVASVVLGNVSTPGLRQAGRYGDISFGLYIYAFPTQQVMIFLFKDKLAWDTILGLTITATAILAFLSWHLVEKWALKLKPKATSKLSIDPVFSSI